MWVSGSDRFNKMLRSSDSVFCTSPPRLVATSLAASAILTPKTSLSIPTLPTNYQKEPKIGRPRPGQ